MSMKRLILTAMCAAYVWCRRSHWCALGERTGNGGGKVSLHSADADRHLGRLASDEKRRRPV